MLFKYLQVLGGSRRGGGGVDMHHRIKLPPEGSRPHGYSSNTSRRYRTQVTTMLVTLGSLLACTLGFLLCLLFFQEVLPRLLPFTARAA
jgi:hypothetical protein